MPEPLKWTSVTNAPEHGADAALFSGNVSNLDATAITPVTVPTANPTLTFDENHGAEEGFDYAYTVISTDGGKTYTALANDNTVDGPTDRRSTVAETRGLGRPSIWARTPASRC